MRYCQPPPFARSSNDFSACAKAAKPDVPKPSELDKAIQTRTRSIQSGRLSKGRLWMAFYYRGKAYAYVRQAKGQEDVDHLPHTRIIAEMDA